MSEKFSLILAPSSSFLPDLGRVENIAAVSTTISDVQVIGEYQNRGVEDQLRAVIEKLLCSEKTASSPSKNKNGNRANNENRAEGRDGRKVDNILINLFDNDSEETLNEKKEEIELDSRRYSNTTPMGSRSGVCCYKNLKQTNPPASLEIWQSLSWPTPSSKSSPHLTPPTRPSTEETVMIKIDRDEHKKRPIVRRQAIERQSLVVNDSSDEQKNVEREKVTPRTYPINFLL